MQTVSIGDSVQEMSNIFFCEISETYVTFSSSRQGNQKVLIFFSYFSTKMYVVGTH